MDSFKLTIITPQETLVDQEDIQSINLKTIAGEMTALKNHAPILTSLSPGKLHFTNDGSNFKFVSVDSGIVQINKLGVTIIANFAEFSK